MFNFQQMIKIDRKIKRNKKKLKIGLVINFDSLLHSIIQI